MRQKIIIIGAGISGLTAGYYALKNGFDVEIFEKHDKPGGYCTSWKRKGFNINSSVHAILGIKENEQYYDLWKELGIIDSVEFHTHDYYEIFHIKGNKPVELSTNISELENFLIDYAPEDKKIIKDFIKALSIFSKTQIKVENEPELTNLIQSSIDNLKLIPHLPVLSKWQSITVKEFSEKFRNQVLKEAFYKTWYPDFSMLMVIILFSNAIKRNIGYAKGGSFKKAEVITSKIIELGGKIHFKSNVTEVLINNKTVKGIHLENGEKHYSDYVISAADGVYTYKNLLKGKYSSKKHDKFYRNPMPADSLIEVYFCIKGKNTYKIKSSLLGTLIKFDKSLKLTNISITDGLMFVNDFDRSIHNNGYIITFSIASKYEDWVNLDKIKYKEDKDKIKKFLLEYIEEKYPDIVNNIEHIEIGTPLTFERYTNNFKGSIQGWLVTGDKWQSHIPKKFSNLNKFYMCGQWTESMGGVPVAAQTGKNVIRLICKANKAKFAV